MEITNDLYKKLFKVALRYAYGNQDNAAVAVNQVLLNMDKFKPKPDDEVTQFWAWARKIIKNKSIELYKKEKLNPINNSSELDLFFNLAESDEVDQMDLLKQIMPQDQIDWCVTYYSNPNKTQADRLKFHYIKEKIVNYTPNKPKYILVDNKTTTQLSFDTFNQIGDYLNLTGERIRQCYTSNLLIKKRYKIK